MKQLSRREMEQHVTILGWLHIVASGIFMIVGVFVFTLLTGIGVAAGDPDAVAVLGVVGTAVGLLLAALSLPGLLAGYGLLRRKMWGRTLALVVGIINLVNVPIGTLIGAYTVWVLLQDSALDYFDTPVSA